MKKLVWFVISILVIQTLTAQTPCKVKLDAINLSYNGACKKGYAHGSGEAKGVADSYNGNFKKGLPHGLGVYIWGNGNVYTGNFSKGKMHGKGKLTLKGESKIKEGYFDNNTYIGIYKNPYHVLSKREIQKVSFQENKLNLGTNHILIKVKHSGRFVSPFLTISDENHSLTEPTGDGVKLMNVQFPLKKVTVTFTYEGFSCYTVFEIYKRGNWEAIIHI